MPPAPPAASLANAGLWFERRRADRWHRLLHPDERRARLSCLRLLTQRRCGCSPSTSSSSSSSSDSESDRKDFKAFHTFKKKEKKVKRRERAEKLKSLDNGAQGSMHGTLSEMAMQHAKELKEAMAQQLAGLSGTGTVKREREEEK